MVFLLQILRCIPILYTLNYWLRILISSPVSVVWSMVCAMHVSGLSVPDQPVFRRYVPVKNMLQKSGITVVPVDLSEILGAARKIEDTDVELLKKLEEIKCYAVVPKEYSDKLVLQAKFGVAVERWIEANQIDAVAVQCWDSLEQNYGCAACVTMSMLGEKLLPAACEV